MVFIRFKIVSLLLALDYVYLEEACSKSIFLYFEFSAFFIV